MGPACLLDLGLRGRHPRRVSEREGLTLTHLDPDGRARMVDVSDKDATLREAVAQASLRMGAATRARLEAGDVPKGDVWATARIAAIQAAKRTSEWIPLCHHIALTAVTVDFRLDGDGERVHIAVRVRARDRTGVEMEAMTGASAAALTLYDMLKAIDRGLVIEAVGLVEKHGGRTGSWVR